MPRYTNSTNQDITIGAQRIPANGYLDMEGFIPTLPDGVTRTAIAPVIHPILVSQVCTGGEGDADTTVAVPSGLISQYTVKIFCAAGLCNVYFNDKSLMTVPKVLAGGLSYELKCMSRVVDSVIISYGANGTVVVVDVVPSV